MPLSSAAKFTLRIAYAALITYTFSASSALAQPFAEIALGGHNLCALDTNGNLSCTTNDSRELYLPPDDGTKYKAVSSGAAHSCAITQAGAIRCWGQNNFGQLDAPDSAVGFVDISIGEGHTCAIDADMKAHCWGLNTNEQTDVPADNSGFQSIYTGTTGSCALKEAGEVVCWSNDIRANSENSNSGYIDLTIGGGGGGKPTCGLTAEGAIDCWITSQYSVDRPTGGPYVDIAANNIFFCGLTAAGQLDCRHRVFDSERVDTASATLMGLVAALPPLATVQISTNSFPFSSICGLGQDGEMYCAGERLPASAIPGSQTNVVAPTNLSFTAYSDTAGELFWDGDDDQRYTIYSGHNIYRNGELLTFTTNFRSYLDDTLEYGVEYTYAISTVADDGTESELSDSITVSTGGRVGSPPPDDEPREFGNPENVVVSRYGEGSLEIFWDRPTGFNNATSFFEIYRNGEYQGIAPGPSYFDPGVNAKDSYTYTIVAVNRPDDVTGVAFANVESLSGADCR